MQNLTGVPYEMLSSKQKGEVYIRICKDSGYRLDMYQAASLAADVLGTSPLEILSCLGLKNMLEIADGTHHCCQEIIDV